MTRGRSYALSLGLLATAAVLNAQSGKAANPPSQPKSPLTKTVQAPARKAPTAPAAMTNQDVIRLAKAKIADDVIISKIKQSKTKFDTSVDAMVALKEAGVNDGVIAVMMDSPAAPAPAVSSSGVSSPHPSLAAGVVAVPPAPPSPKSASPASNAGRPAAATPTSVAAPAKGAPPRPVEISIAPHNYGVYVWSGGELKPLGRIQTKVQISKFRSLLKSIPFVRQKIDINIPGAHSSSRFDDVRPTFFAFFPPSRDVSKFKLLQCKITGQRYDQRTLANASILFSTEQNQDEVTVDVGPTSVKDLYRIFPREDIPSGEFGFVEGNTGSKSTSNIEILDVYDFAVDRKEDKLSLRDYLQTIPAADVGDTTFLTWTKDECRKIIDDREGKVGITGGLLTWFKRQYASLDVYWADAQFARAFARMEMLDRGLVAADGVRLASLLLSPDGSYYIIVSIGGKLGSGKLIGANEGERLMRPFDASLSDDKSKVVVGAKRLDFVGGYAGLWKVTFDQESVRGPLMRSHTLELIFEARLNQNLDFKAKFAADKIDTAANGSPAGQ